MEPSSCVQPWLLGEAICNSSIHRKDMSGISPEEERLRLYRLWLIRNTEKFSIELVNFWIIMSIVRSCKSVAACFAFNNNSPAPYRLAVWGSIMIRGLVGCNPSYLDPSLQVSDIAERIVTALPDVKFDSAFCHAIFIKNTPSAILPRMSTTEFFNVIDLIPTAALQKFLRRKCHGPRCFRVENAQKFEDICSLLSSDPPVVGSDLVLRVAQAHTQLQPNSSLEQRLHFIFKYNK